MPTARSSARFTDGLSLFRAAVDRAGDLPAIHYFDATIDYRDIDRLSDALACRLIEDGVLPTDRVALYLQNTPHFVIGLMAIWKAGATCVPINPMNRQREAEAIFADCSPRALICLEELYVDVIAALDSTLCPAIVIRVDPTEFQSRNDSRIFPPDRASSAAMTAFAGLARVPAAPSVPAPTPEDIAMLVYTSGTTGTPKGAIITHRAFSFNAHAFCEVAELAEGAPILGIAPLFHITGSVACLGSAFVRAAPIILTYRFDVGAVLDAIAEWRPTFVVAAVTAFIAILNDTATSASSFSSLAKVYSGGAPVPPSFIAQFEAKFGRYIHNCYGLTETAAPTHIVPLGQRAPVGAEDGTLSIGKASPGVTARIVDDAGAELGDGVSGELAIAGPMVAPGYWNNPAETAANMTPVGFRTGDIAFRDADGWYYLVDRKKDVIISSGYKVWPREVEDVLYTHEAVREAAVVGVADPYRGETVKAVVSLKAGASADPQELVDFCKSRMAAYKYPRIVEIIAELPKTPTGKILRRSVR